MSLTARDLARVEAAEASQQRMLLEGHGVASNASLAIFWFRRAADQLDGSWPSGQ
jgi:TPR repeat protein